MQDDITTLRRILASARTIAVVGLSAEWHRPSHFAAKYMQAKGYRVIPVNPRYESILGERCVARLEDIAEPVDIVDVFRRTEDVEPIADSAVCIGAKCLWQQIGVKNFKADEVMSPEMLIELMATPAALPVAVKVEASVQTAGD
jgi:predicted CoA-binding protein